MINRQKSMWNLAELKKFDPKYSGPSNGLPFFFCRDFLSLFFFIYLRVIIRSFVSFCSVIKGFFFFFYVTQVKAFFLFVLRMRTIIFYVQRAIYLLFKSHAFIIFFFFIIFLLQFIHLFFEFIFKHCLLVRSLFKGFLL